jgi:hypothetical protein
MALMVSTLMSDLLLPSRKTGTRRTTEPFTRQQDFAVAPYAYGKMSGTIRLREDEWTIHIPLRSHLVHKR